MPISVGQIGLDLVVNQGTFHRQMSKIQSVAKKAGAALAGAFAVKKLVDFGKSCINLGSDLAEVQNVVDVTFPKMNKQIDKFAKAAAGSFGLSETMAKKFTGTFGSMAEAFGFSEKESYKMSTALTGLAGDVASFYNISQDEAYTKLKSVFSGETETLKDLGVVMTQSALDAYALGNGYGKVTAKMSEAEKVSLRLAFVQDKLKNAAGDFARTSNSWTNQTRILSLQFDSLKASIGQGLINVFTPVVKWMNILISKITVAAEKFKKFTELLTGNKSGNDGASTTADSMDSAASSSEKVAGNTKKAAKEAKKLQKAVYAFDHLNKQDSEDTSDSDSKGSGSDKKNTKKKSDTGTEGISKLAEILEKLKKKFVILQKKFLKGFKIGLGDISVLDSIKDNLDSIKESLIGLLSAKDLQQAFINMILSLTESVGKILGAFVSIGLTIADNITGGIAKYLKQNTKKIKDYLIGMFDITSEIAEITANFYVAIADIFTVFRSDDAKQITADLIKIFADAFMGVTELSWKISADILKTITQPFADNKDSIKQALEGILKPIRTITSSIAEFVENTFDKLSGVYDKYISPAFENIASGLSEILSACLEGYEKYLKPVIDWIANRFSKLISKYINPLIDSFLEFAGKATEALSMLFDFLSPFLGWFIQKFIAQISKKMQWLWTKVEVAVSAISVILKGIFDVLSGVIDFIVGVFTSDWDKAWEGIKNIFKAIWNTIKSLVKVAINAIKNVVATVLNKLRGNISVILSGIRLIFGNSWNKIKKVFTEFDKFLSGVFQKDFSKSFGAFGEIMNAFKKNAENIWKAIKKVFSGIIDFITGVFTGDWKKAWQGVKKIFGGIFDGLVAVAKAPLNLIIGLINAMLQGIFKGMNWVIGKLQKIHVKVPEWVPGFGGKEWGFNDLHTIDASKLKIKYLANGGYVKPNTPQLAMIGDNRHQGEVVAPEDKLEQLLNNAILQNTAMIVRAVENAMCKQKSGDIELVVNLGNKKIAREVLSVAAAEKKRMGKTVYNI